MFLNEHLWGGHRAAFEIFGHYALFNIINHERTLNHHKAFFADKMLQNEKTATIKGKVESEIDILQEEYNEG